MNKGRSMLRPYNKDWMKHWHSRFRYSRMFLAVVRLCSPQAECGLDPRLR